MRLGYLETMLWMRIQLLSIDKVLLLLEWPNVTLLCSCYYACASVDTNLELKTFLR